MVAGYLGKHENIVIKSPMCQILYHLNWYTCILNFIDNLHDRHTETFTKQCNFLFEVQMLILLPLMWKTQWRYCCVLLLVEEWMVWLKCIVYEVCKIKLVWIFIHLAWKGLLVFGLSIPPFVHLSLLPSHLGQSINKVRMAIH